MDEIWIETVDYITLSVFLFLIWKLYGEDAIEHFLRDTLNYLEVKVHAVSSLHIHTQKA